MDKKNLSSNDKKSSFDTVISLIKNSIENRGYVNTASRVKLNSLVQNYLGIDSLKIEGIESRLRIGPITVQEANSIMSQLTLKYESGFIKN